MRKLIELCSGCPNGAFCRKHGCTTWNDVARAKYNTLKKQAKKSNKEIDEIIEWLK